MNTYQERYIAQMIDATIRDNKEFIIENDQTVAEYLLQAGTSFDELSVFWPESDEKYNSEYTDDEAKATAQEIEKYIQDNYSYKLKAE